jgi:hypothetical protein
MSFVERRPDFRKFDENGGRFVLTWNWFALLFGPLWYLFQGMWPKALAYLVLISIAGVLTGGLGVLAGHLALGAIGNYDLYLLRRHDVHFWELPSEAPHTAGPGPNMTTAGLTELKALRDQGLISEDEYATKHARILRDAEIARAIATLERGLRAGVITHEEYERKKHALRRG